jgi:23S rRNA pseudouridine2605 synthase
VRAYGRVAQARLDGLRNGIEIDGVRYGAIEATLEREQGDNVWLGFAMREGKNREIRNVLGALGLKVNRLIRVSYGPFQLGELPAGAVMEVKTRALREQLGERLAALAGADFSGPLVARDSEREVVRLQTQTSTRHPEVRGAKREVAPLPPRSGGEGPRKRRGEKSWGGGSAREKGPPPPTPLHHALRARGEGRRRGEAQHRPHSGTRSRHDRKPTQDH